MRMPRRHIFHQWEAMLTTCWLLSCMSMPCTAQIQRRIVVLDMDTRQPVKGVAVKADRHPIAETDLLGRVSVPVVFDSITFSHVRYEHERLLHAEVSDTMYLLPKEHTLPEVNVTAASPQMLAMFKAWALQGAMMGAAEAPGGVVTFDFASMLDRRGRRDKKHLERAKEILKEWDKKPDDSEK